MLQTSRLHPVDSSHGHGHDDPSRALYENKTYRMSSSRSPTSRTQYDTTGYQQQFAYPSTSSSGQGDTSEHFLRRKTPNGTFPAGYDGSSVGWMQKPHAQKHVLVPTSKFSHRPGFNPSWFPQRGSEPPAGQFPSSALPRGVQPDSFENPYAAAAAGGFAADSSANLCNRTVGHAYEGMDSMLNQSPYQPYPFGSSQNMNVPTVLQPLWPPFVGATSLQTPSSVGPYWPDGAFEPYRPAPLRDMRYGQTCHSSETDQRNPSCPPQNYYQQIYTQPTPVQIMEPTDTRRGYPSMEAHHAVSTKDISYAAGLPYDFDLKLAIGKGREEVPVTSRRQSLIGPDNIRLADTQFSTTFLPDKNGQAHFKERILAWAYRIYCTLLNSIEALRREQHDNAASTSISTQYWHPPRRPYPSWSRNNSNLGAQSGDTKTLSSALGSATGDLSSDQVTADSQGQWSNSFNKIQTGFPEISPISPLESHQRDAASNHWQSRSYQAASHPSYVPIQLVPDNEPKSPASAAFNAMDILSRLCQESHWQWLDGMLLTGCLAYGLGHYSKATKWYLKILRRDPSNVEAMSNLAATYLALGRNHEAEQYWMRSVKQRPGYFEAAEHLVGLLHEQRRGKEAVEVINFIESALKYGTRSKSRMRTHDSQGPLQGPQAYSIPPCDNGRLLALIHGKGNVLYQSADNDGAAKAFEDAILLGTGHYNHIGDLISNILKSFSERWQSPTTPPGKVVQEQPVLLPPEAALETSRLVFPPNGILPGLQNVPAGMAQKASVSVISNSLLSLAKIYQDGMSSSGASATAPRATSGVQEILALYYLSLSLQPSPSTANNVGILLAGVQQSARASRSLAAWNTIPISGVVPGSGVALALAYYDYGLKLDARHAHLYTNLGSLFKDIGQLSAAIRMYEKAVDCDGNFDIALANLANAVKDKGNISDAIQYYQRAVTSNPDFAEAVCGLANALNSVCRWNGRGGIYSQQGNLDRWHVDEHGLLYHSDNRSKTTDGWMEKVVAIVEKQLDDGRNWGRGVLVTAGIHPLTSQLNRLIGVSGADCLKRTLKSWTGAAWEGAKVVRLVERATKIINWQAYRKKHVDRVSLSDGHRRRPQLPAVLAIPTAPTVLPFHTFTSPLSAKQIRLISQRNGLRVSCSTLRASWLPQQIYEPPLPPNPFLIVGYISSDFNNHPLAHLMQSVFGMHDPSRVRAICYATTASDGSTHRQQIEREAPSFYDCSTWTIERLVNQVVSDGVHILVNLNGYTRGAKNEVFAARPAPVQMSFMGFAGTLGAEWCDYLLADRTVIPSSTLRPYRRNVDTLDQTQDANNDDNTGDWVYGENIIFTRDTFFCCDHRQSAPDAHEARLSWPEEKRRRWKMRKELFPDLADDVVILANFNQLYKVRCCFRSAGSPPLLN